MFFNQSDTNSALEIYTYDRVDWIETVDRPELIAFVSNIGEYFTAFLIDVKNSELEYPEQMWDLAIGEGHFKKTANMMVLINYDNVVNCFLGDQHVIQDYKSDKPIDGENLESIIDSIYYEIHKDQDHTPSDDQVDQDEKIQDDEHICSIDYDLISSNFKDLISTEILNLESIIENNKKSIDDALKNLKLEENININTQVDSTGLNTVLSNIDTALVNLENSLGSINSAIKEVDRVVDKDSANKTDSISLAVLKLESAAKILNDQIDASVDLNSRIRLNIDDIALAQNKLITSLNQHLVDSTTASSNLMSGIKAEVNSLKQQIVESNLIVQNLIQKVEQNDSNVVNSVSNLQNHISEIGKRIDNYDLNICSANMTKKKFFEDIIEFLKKGGLALIASFWAVVVILLIKEVIL